MNIVHRFETTHKLERRGRIRIGNDIVISHGDHVHVETETELKHPYDGHFLDNPMTWDTFTHEYLLDKRRSDVK